MIDKLTYKFKVTATMADATGKMGVVGILSLLQDVATIHSREMGADGPTLLKESNAYWVVTKTRVEITRLPAILEEVVAETWPHSPKGVKCGRSHVVRTADGELLFKAYSEWAVLDADTHAVRRPSTTCMPGEGEYISDPPALEVRFLRLRPESDPEKLAYSRPVRYTDLDLSNHVNNVRYAAILLDGADEASLSRTPSALEIHYGREAHLGHLMTVTCDTDGDGTLLAAFSDEEQMLACMKLEF